MNLLAKLWQDEAGVILSAEAVVVGTVAVLGVSAGLSTVATSVNRELQDVAFAIRSLDQSYEIPGQQNCCASTAGSSFRQQAVDQSLLQLCAVEAASTVATEGTNTDSAAAESDSRAAAKERRRLKKAAKSAAE